MTVSRLSIRSINVWVVQADPKSSRLKNLFPDSQGGDHLDLWRRLKNLRAARRNLIVVDPDTLHRSTERMLVGASRHSA